MPDETMIPLAEVIQDLRRELLSAMALGKGEALRFQLKPIELEFTVGVTRAAGGKGGVKFWVLELGADAKRESTTTHKIKLVLEPTGAAGGPPDLVRDPVGDIK